MVNFLSREKTIIMKENFKDLKWNRLEKQEKLQYSIYGESSVAFYMFK